MKCNQQPDPPNILAFPLALAQKTLSEAGYMIRNIELTAPPHCLVKGDKYRIVRQRLAGDNSINVVVACSPEYGLSLRKEVE